jgi:hypothetical protein
VGDGRAFRKAGRNPVVELLPLEDRHHLGVGTGVDRLPSGQLLQKHGQARAVVVLFKPWSNAF